MQCAEVGDAIDTEHDSLAVNDELLMPVLKRRLDDPGIAIGPVVRASGNQAISVALQAEAVSVVLNLVQPVRAIGDGGRLGRQAKNRRCWALMQMGWH